VSRQDVWRVISEAKEGRVVILTTHSMEEADVLSDRIAIGTIFPLFIYFLTFLLKLHMVNSAVSELIYT
jgi:hypothetical protein